MSGLPHSEAAERNREPILAVLRAALGGGGRVLEIGAGTGQHAAFFAAQLPHLSWLPTDRREYLDILRARRAAYAGNNLEPPRELDVDRFPPLPHFDAAYTANTLHIMGWPSARRMLREVGARLPAAGRFIVYGPFDVGGCHTSASNARFHASLRAQAPHMGLRGREAVCREADAGGMSLVCVHAMPANNQALVFERRSRGV